MAEKAANQRFRAIGERWGELIVLAVLGAAVSGILAPLVVPFINHIIVDQGLVIPAAVLVGAVFLQFAWGRPLACLGLHHLPFYPPTWFAGVLGFIFLALLWTVEPPAFLLIGDAPLDRSLLLENISRLKGASCWMALVTLLSSAVFIWFGTLIVDWCRKKSNQSEISAWQSSEEIDMGSCSVGPVNNFDVLKTWISNDVEIEVPGDDLFGHFRLARRIAERLTECVGGDGETPTLALVGPLGSGKSSIRKLAEHRLRTLGVLDRSIAVVPISLWPFESPEAAVLGILRRLSEELSLHVNAPSLSGIPDQYVQLIEYSGSRWANSAKILRRTSEPEVVLKRFESISTAIGLTVVLWIEDLERFAATGGESTGNWGQLEDKRLGPVRSLLHLLDRTQHLTVVLASNTLRPTFDMEKLARFIEHIPRIDDQRAGKLIEFFRTECLRMLDRMCDSAGSNRLADLGQLSQEQMMLSLGNEPEVFSIRTAIIILCETPRVIKQALRATLDVWRPLVGEIDFDDVLLMSVLRVSLPDVFVLVDDHIDQLRKGIQRSETGEVLGLKEFSKRLREELTGIDSRKQRAAREVLNFVFPNQNKEVAFSWLPDRPQGFAFDLHEDYWARFLSVPTLLEEQRDQPVLSAIELWNNEATGPLPEMVSQPDHALAVETFSRGLLPARLNDLLRAVVEKRLPEVPADWPEGNYSRKTPPGIVPVWRIMNRNRIDRDALEELLLQLSETTTRQSLQLADELLSHFANGSPSADPLLNPRAQTRLWLKAREVLAGLSPAEIMQSLRGASPFVLFQFSWGLARINSKRMNGLPFEGWKEFSSNLLSALEEEPGTVMHHVLPFVIDREFPDRFHKGSVFDRETAERLFDFQNLLRLLKENLGNQKFNEPEIEEMANSVSEAIN